MTQTGRTGVVQGLKKIKRSTLGDRMSRCGSELVNRIGVRAMRNHARRTAYAIVGILALAFGWIEASAVVYLREIYTRELLLQGVSDVRNLQVTLVSLPDRLVALEMVREACTIVLLGVVAWLAGRRPADRAGAFLLSFGIWDLAYYGVLQLVVGWPDSLSTWDILFLIPLPWVAPVWAPISVAALFVLAGSYLFWTSERQRRYRWTDIGVLTLSVALTIAAFLSESGSVMDHGVPGRFPVWLFWAGVALGTVWVAQVEGRAARTARARPPSLGVRVRTILPEHPGSGATNVPPAPAGDRAEERVRGDPRSVIWEYTETRRRLDGLMQEARELGERLERLGQGLSGHPGRMIVGLPSSSVEDPSEWDIVPSYPLPPIDRLMALTNQIRAVGAKVEELRESLILMGRADVVEQPDGFFH